MKAEYKPTYDPHRTILKDVVPLDTPMGVMIQNSTICNARCNYCYHAFSDEKKRDRNFIVGLMDMNIAERIAEQLSEFPGKMKQIQHWGMGEPLCHPKLSEIIKKLMSVNKAERHLITTNGILLTPEKSIELLETGIDKLTVSLQGIDSQRYSEVCGVNLDFDSFIDNLRFFYNNRNKYGHCLLEFKIIDIALRDGEREKFFEIFGDICDTIHIDHAVPLDNDLVHIKGDGINKWGLKLPQTDNYTCGHLFYFLNIKPNGDVIPCHECHEPIIGNVQNETLRQIWYGEKRTDMMVKQLKKQRDLIPACKNCPNKYGLCGVYENDKLIDDADELIVKIEKNHTKIRRILENG